MNLKLIDAAMAAYKDISQEDINRLAFFRSIWGVQAAAAEACGCDYTAPSEHDLGICAAKGSAVFKMAPVSVSAKLLAKTAADIDECIVVKKMLAAEPQALLDKLDWAEVIGRLDIAVAGSDPTAFLDLAAQALLDGGASDQAAGSALDVLTQALRCQLEAPAQRVVAAYRAAGLFEDLHPLACPCCGSAPTLSHVGGKTSSQGRGRLLVCPQCATAWEFERIRCARCGQKNPNHLHYFNIEGDDAHRIATCDDCGGYMRTLFSEEGDLNPVSYEVEDVVMARLDAIAADPRFHAE